MRRFLIATLVVFAVTLIAVGIFAFVAFFVGRDTLGWSLAGGAVPPELVGAIALHDSDDEALDEALEKKVSFAFEEKPLGQALAQLNEMTGANVLLTPSYRLQRIGSDEPVTLTVDNVSMRQALRLMLRSLDLTLVSEDGVLLVADNEETIIRVYPVPDLVVVPHGNTVQLIEDELIELIQNVVDTNSWEDSGGKGTIEFSLPALSLVVNQTRRNHERLRELLLMLRAGGERTSAILDEIGAPSLAKTLAARPRPSVLWDLLQFRLAPLRGTKTANIPERPAEVLKAIEELKSKAKGKVPSTSG